MKDNSGRPQAAFTGVNARKSILFVDDEQMVLQGLRRTMRAFRDKWEGEFVDSGEEALRVLETRKFDVIVSDMMMPSMNGADLLCRVRERHPRMVRIILSGHADSELIDRCVGSTHRFLSKPCDPAAFRAALDRATSIVFALQNEALASVVAKIDRLPSPPAICLELERLLQSPSVSVTQIGELVGRDLSMSAQVLKLVNSAYFGIPVRLETPEEAVTYLGVDVIRTLALCIHLNGELKQQGLSAGLIERLWRHSLRVSACARSIALAENACASVVKEAATAGLLHDIGKLILRLNFPEEARHTAEVAASKSLPLSVAEEQVFGCTHADVGGYLLSLWGLPMPVVEAVAWHHSPRLSTAPGFSVTLAVHCADALSNELPAESEPGCSMEMDAECLRGLGLLDRIPRWREIAASQR